MSNRNPSSSTKRATRKIIQEIPSIRSLSKRNCPPGMILRKAYTRKYSSAVRNRGFTVRKEGRAYRVVPKAKSMFVEAGCIKNVGNPGKGPKLFGPLRKGELAKHGYSYRLSNSERRGALKKAMNEYGVIGVYRKLNAVAKLSKRASPSASNVFSRDREWVHSQK